MKKIMKMLVPCALCLVPLVANAVPCAVCTIAIGAGLEGARLLGVDDIITGIWAGAFTLTLFFWTVSWLKKRGCNHAFWCIVVPFILCYSLVGCVYLLPGIDFGANTLCGIDKFLIGLVVGSVSLYLADRWNAKIKKNNGGKVRFPFQKVVIPMSVLLLVTGVFAVIVYWDWIAKFIGL